MGGAELRSVEKPRSAPVGEMEGSRIFRTFFLLHRPTQSGELRLPFALRSLYNLRKASVDVPRACGGRCGFFFAFFFSRMEDRAWCASQHWHLGGHSLYREAREAGGCFIATTLFFFSRLRGPFFATRTVADSSLSSSLQDLFIGAFRCCLADSKEPQCLQVAMRNRPGLLRVRTTFFYCSRVPREARAEETR